MTILGLLNKVQALDTDKVSIDSIDSCSEDMIDYQKKQLYSGKTSTGEKLEDTKGGHYKWESYADEKFKMNSTAGYGNPDLYYTGAFYRGITVNVVGNSVIIESTDSKAQGLESKYGADEIFGLNDEHRKEFISEKLRPTFMQKIRNELF